VTPPRLPQVREWRYDDRRIELRQGQEMGRFQLGSTVVMLFPPGELRFNAEWAPARAIRLGEVMATFDRAQSAA
jgi:phosphatidylserine decarboxylase